MFEDFTIPAHLHDAVFYEMVESGYVPNSRAESFIFPSREDDYECNDIPQ